MTVINLSLLDAYGRTSKKSLVTSLTTVAAIQTFLDAHLPLWAGVSGVGIIEAQVTVPLTVAPQTPVAGSNMDEGATFQVLTGAGYRTAHKVPAPITAIRQSGGTIDLTNAAVIAYFADFDVTDDGRVNRLNPTPIDSVIIGKLDK